MYNFSKVLIIVLSIIFSVEVFVMFILDQFPVQNDLLEMIIDGVLLSLFSAPALYFILIKNILKKNQILYLDLKAKNDYINAATLIVETSLQGSIKFVNDKFCEVSGFSKEELLGKNHNLVSSGQHSIKFWQQFWQTILSGEIWSGEICNQTKDGQLFWLHCYIIPIKNKKNELVSFSAISHDITYHKESEARVQHTAKLSSIGDLAAGVAHEVNNPLAILKGYLSILITNIHKEKELEPGYRDKVAQRMELAIDRISKIVNSLLIFSKKKSNQLEPVNINEIVSDTVNLFTNYLKEEGVRFSVNLQGEEIFIFGQIDKLQQILFNLISNAKDASEKKESRELSVKTILMPDKKMAIEVCDNGIGIPKEIKSKIFDPFFTTKEVGKGMGVGLSLVHNYVQDMEGQIEIDSQINQGTKFRLIFPVHNHENESIKKSA